MAQVVGYYQNNVEYEEGPFVITSLSNGYRIEVEMPGHHCPVLPNTCVYTVMKRLGMDGWSPKEVAARVCDHLNAMWASDLIILEDKTYCVSKDFDAFQDLARRIS